MKKAAPRAALEHPEMILGEMKMLSGRFGPEPSCVPYEGADLAEQLSEAVANIHGEITAYEIEDELTEEDNSIPADPTVRNFSYTLVDGKIYFRENSRMAGQKNRHSFHLKNTVSMWKRSKRCSRKT